jgi:hypothetical protein
MSMIQIPVSRANACGFEAFGRHLCWREVARSAPTFSEPNFDWWGKLAILFFPEGLELGLLRLRQREPVIDRLERHLQSAELIIPVDGDFIIPVSSGASSERGIAAHSVGAFELHKEECIIINPGTCHGPPLPLDKDASVILALQNDTPATDLEFQPIENNDTVRFEI